MHKILIVEDDAVIAGEIAATLLRWGLSAYAVTDFSDVMGEFERFMPELVLMDVSLPFYNGFYWCERIRKTSGVPIMFLSSRADNMDVVMGMNMGGDDYIAKPVSPSVLIAKIQAMLRRAYDYEAPNMLALADAVLDAASCCIERGGEKTELTKNECRILKLLLQNKGAVVSREQLMLALWNSDEFVDDNTLTVNINRLRRKLDSIGLGSCIRTCRSQGYAAYEKD